MQNDPFRTFTDRREATELFKLLRGRDDKKPWPLLPILAFIAPGGGGKSTLINYLLAQCCLPDGRAAIPYAQLDFSQPDAPKTLLAILVTIRNQLQQHLDGQGHYMTFPRFDLGASIILSHPVDGTPPLLDPKQIQKQLVADSALLGSLIGAGNAAADIAGVIPLPLNTATATVIRALLAGLKLTTHIPAVQNLVTRIESGPGWRWYQANTTDPGLRAKVGIDKVLLRLQFLSTPGNPGRDYLIKDVLPAALIADIREAMESGRVWSKTGNVVLFLDGFQSLLQNADKAGIILLERFALSEQRKRGENDPLLIVLGSQQRVLQYPQVPQKVMTGQLQPINTILEASAHAKSVYQDWQTHLPPDKHPLRLSDMYLEVWLDGFGLTDTHDYLSRVSNQQRALTDSNRVQAIYLATLGHPFSLALIAAAILEAQIRGGDVSIEKVWDAFVSPERAPGHEDETIGAYLLSLFLQQLPRKEQDDLMFCAASRTLDAATLRAALQLPSDIEARERLNRYRQLAFMHVIDAERIVFHRIVRTLLLQQLVSNVSPDSDYYSTHSRLRDHFHKCVANLRTQQSTPAVIEAIRRASMEEVYHSLALGNPELAIYLALLTLKDDPDLWEQLHEAVEQAPKGLMSAETKQRAEAALNRAEQSRTHMMKLLLSFFIHGLVEICQRPYHQYEYHVLVELKVAKADHHECESNTRICRDAA